MACTDPEVLLTSQTGWKKKKRKERTVVKA